MVEACYLGDIGVDVLLYCPVIELDSTGLVYWPVIELDLVYYPVIELDSTGFQ
jgi:hypothetical protein